MIAGAVLLAIAVVGLAVLAWDTRRQCERPPVVDPFAPQPLGLAWERWPDTRDTRP